MKKLGLGIAILLLFTVDLEAQLVSDLPKNTAYPFQKWTQAEFDEANTAKSDNYLTEQEKLVIFYSNLARINGKLFADTYVKQYTADMENTAYIKSLFEDLNKQPKTAPLKSSKELFEIAKGHAVTSGKTGHVGHNEFSARYKNALKKYWGVAENCSYGHDDAFLIIIQLLIDEGVSSLGHRKSILSAAYEFVGTSIQPHTEYDYNCVMSFGGKSSE